MAPLLPAARNRALAAHASVAPVVALSAPMPYALTPFRVVKEPPTMTREPSGEVTIVHTYPLSTVGLQGSIAPFVALKAASSMRGWLFAARKLPPI